MSFIQGFLEQSSDLAKYSLQSGLVLKSKKTFSLRFKQYSVPLQVKLQLGGLGSP